MCFEICKSERRLTECFSLMVASANEADSARISERQLFLSSSVQVSKLLQLDFSTVIDIAVPT